MTSLTTRRARPVPTPTSTAVVPGGDVRAIDLARHQSATLVGAFTLSLAHTVYAEVAGLASPDFTVRMPTTWAFYAVGFGMAVLARRRGGVWPARVVTAFVGALTLVSVFVYPTTFTVQQQTAFGWFENDVYVSLLTLALYLGGLRLRGAGTMRTVAP